MRLILDSCVGVKWVLPETDSSKALALRADIRRNVHKVLAPDIFGVEVAHALTKAQRQGRMSEADVYALWFSVMRDRPEMFSHLPLMPRAISLATANRIGIYDCLYVALCEQEQCQIVSADAKLTRIFPSQVVSLDSL